MTLAALSLLAFAVLYILAVIGAYALIVYVFWPKKENP